MTARLGDALGALFLLFGAGFLLVALFGWIAGLVSALFEGPGILGRPRKGRK